MPETGRQNTKQSRNGFQAYPMATTTVLWGTHGLHPGAYILETSCMDCASFVKVLYPLTWLRSPCLL